MKTIIRIFMVAALFMSSPVSSQPNPNPDGCDALDINRFDTPPCDPAEIEDAEGKEKCEKALAAWKAAKKKAGVK